MKGNIDDFLLGSQALDTVRKIGTRGHSKHLKARKLRTIARYRKRWAKKQSIKRYKY